MSHDLLVYLAKTVGLIWLMAFFVIVVIRTYNPSRLSAHDRAARSILEEEGGHDWGGITELNTRHCQVT